MGVYFDNPKNVKVDDCTSDEFFNTFKAVSRQNTIAFDEVFKRIPSDNILTFEDLRTYEQRPCLSKTDPKSVINEKIVNIIYNL